MISVKGLASSFLGTATGTITGGLGLKYIERYRTRRTKNGKVVIERVRRRR